MRVIGAADEFWRLRITRVDATGAPDFEWREDVLYRSVEAQVPEEAEVWSVEAIRIEDYDSIVAIGTYEDREQAEAVLQRASEDLAEMTKHEFEAAYLTPAGTVDSASGV